jgi:SOS-response transcriptional repressor LexA
MQTQPTPTRRPRARLNRIAGPNVFLFPDGKPAAKCSPPVSSLIRQRERTFNELLRNPKETIDLRKYLMPNPAKSLYVRVCGESMTPGIQPDDLCIGDSAESFTSGDVVLAYYADEVLIKRLHIDEDGRCWLVSDNHDFDPLSVPADCIFAKVTFVIHSLKEGGE